MGHRPVVLPKPDEPEESSVRVPVQACARAVRTRNRKAQLSDLADPSPRGDGTGRFGNGFGRRWGDDAFCIHGSPKLPRPLRGSRTRQSGARRPSIEGFVPPPPGPAPRPERVGAGGDGLRRYAGNGLSAGAPRHGQDVRRVRPSVRSWVASSNDPSSFEATPVTSRLEPGRSCGGRSRSFGFVPRRQLRFGGNGEARRGPGESAGRPSGRTRSGAEGATRDATWVRDATAREASSSRTPAKRER